MEHNCSLANITIPAVPARPVLRADTYPPRPAGDARDHAYMAQCTLLGDLSAATFADVYVPPAPLSGTDLSVSGMSSRTLCLAHLP